MVGGCTFLFSKVIRIDLVVISGLLRRHGFRFRVRSEQKINQEFWCALDENELCRKHKDTSQGELSYISSMWFGIVELNFVL